MYDTYKNLCDLHTHSVFSLHGMSSPSEMVDAAIRKGLECIAITDHYYPDHKGLQYLNQMARIDHEIDRCFSYVFDKIHVVPGAECNLFADDEFSETYDRFDDRQKSKRLNSDRFLLIGLHSWYVPDMAELRGCDLLDEFAKRIHSGVYNCIAHPSRGLSMIPKIGNTKVNKQVLLGILNIMHAENMPLEINESDCHDDVFICLDENDRYFSMSNMVRHAKKIGMDVIINTDAHVHYAVGEIDNALKLLESCNYPADKIINFDRDKIKELIKCR